MKKFINMLSFIALVAIAASLALSFIPAIAGPFKMVAELLAYAVVAVYAFMFVKSKRYFVWHIVYWVSLVLLIVLYYFSFSA